jgi:alkylation response protein AidB-like acyl-CoA dehydrogenase
VELSLSSDQELLRSSTRNFLGKESGSAQLRRLSESPLGFERGWWATAAELGWTSLLAPESLNGGSASGDPLQDLAILAEEAGQFAAPGPLGITNAVVTALVHGGITDHAPDLAEIMAGSKVVTWAVYEPGNGWGPLRPSVKAERVEGGFRLTGVKDRVEAGDQADLFLVTAMLDGVVRQFLIPAEAQGISIERVWSLDFTRHFARISFENAYAVETTIVGTAQNTDAITELQWQVLNVLQCAETCGVTDRAFNMALLQMLP